MYMYQTIEQTAQYLKERTTIKPKTAVILGSGLGDFAEGMEL